MKLPAYAGAALVSLLTSCAAPVSEPSHREVIVNDDRSLHTLDLPAISIDAGPLSPAASNSGDAGLSHEGTGRRPLDARAACGQRLSALVERANATELASCPCLEFQGTPPCRDSSICGPIWSTTLLQSCQAGSGGSGANSAGLFRCASYNALRTDSGDGKYVYYFYDSHTGALSGILGGDTNNSQCRAISSGFQLPAECERGDYCARQSPQGSATHVGSN